MRHVLVSHVTGFNESSDRANIRYEWVMCQGQHQANQRPMNPPHPSHALRMMRHVHMHCVGCVPGMGRAATERFSAQLPRTHWSGPEAWRHVGDSLSVHIRWMKAATDIVCIQHVTHIHDSLSQLPQNHVRIMNETCPVWIRHVTHEWVGWKRRWGARASATSHISMRMHIPPAFIISPKSQNFLSMLFLDLSALRHKNCRVFSEFNFQPIFKLIFFGFLMCFLFWIRYFLARFSKAFVLPPARFGNPPGAVLNPSVRGCFALRFASRPFTGGFRTLDFGEFLGKPLAKHVRLMFSGGHVATSHITHTNSCRTHEFMSRTLNSSRYSRVNNTPTLRTCSCVQRLWELVLVSKPQSSTPDHSGFCFPP